MTSTAPSLSVAPNPDQPPVNLVAVPRIPADVTAPFVSTPPSVTLLKEESTAHPFALTIAAAWSCYGARPAKVENVLKLIQEQPPTGLTPEKAADRALRRDRALK